VSTRRQEIIAALVALLRTEGFWVQAQEQDGEEERLTVSYGGDDGQWMTVRVEIHVSNQEHPPAKERPS
jgi:hypothetical protein